MTDNEYITTTAADIPSLKRRMAAWLYEGMLLFGVTFATDYVFSVLTNTRSQLWLSSCSST